MKVDNKLVDKVAALAKLQFEGEEKEAIKLDMQRILEFMDKLNEVDTDNVEPLKYMTEEHLRLRPDVAKTTITKADALKNAPEKDSDYFKVPTVLKK